MSWCWYSSPHFHPKECFILYIEKKNACCSKRGVLLGHKISDFGWKGVGVGFGGGVVLRRQIRHWFPISYNISCVWKNINEQLISGIFMTPIYTWYRAKKGIAYGVSVMVKTLNLHSLNVRTSYLQKSWGLEATRLDVMEALKGHVKFLKKFLYLLIRTYASPN